MFSSGGWTNNISRCDIERKSFLKWHKTKLKSVPLFTSLWAEQTLLFIWYWTLVCFTGFFSPVSRLQFSVTCTYCNFPRIFPGLYSDGTELSLSLESVCPLAPDQSADFAKQFLYFSCFVGLEVLRIKNEIIAQTAFALGNYFIKAIPMNSTILIALANHVTNSVSYLDVKYEFHRTNFRRLIPVANGRRTYSSVALDCA